ncbi:cobalamin-dependent protein [Amycolatopsis sp. NPDC051128]|uniref:cobalamin-dependent protein n=1 Tax=Amycolatopsis sp. NPDC051128 TaxID=3155412 RepID=UPI0034210EBF
MSRERLRVLLVEFTRPDPAAAALGRVLRDAGMEVVHAGPLATAEQVLRTAEQEDPDAIGVLGSAPSPKLTEALNDVRVFAAADFETPGDAAKWLTGGRSHTSDAPSDRAR